MFLQLEHLFVELVDVMLEFFFRLVYDSIFGLQLLNLFLQTRYLGLVIVGNISKPETKNIRHSIHIIEKNLPRVTKITFQG